MAAARTPNMTVPKPLEPDAAAPVSAVTASVLIISRARSCCGLDTTSGLAGSGDLHQLS